MPGVPGAAATRRDLMRLALSAGAAATGAGLLDAPSAVALASTDADLVKALLGTEHLAVFVYGHTVHSGVLTPDAQRLARRLLGQERAHARSMAVMLRRSGGTSPPSLTSVGDADKLLAASGIQQSLTQLRSQDDFLQLLIHLEIVLERSYYASMSKVLDSTLQVTVAQVLASEAQHATVLTELLLPGQVEKAVPEAFVEGNPGDARV
jgi:Ferritin-like domain